MATVPRFDPLRRQSLLDEAASLRRSILAEAQDDPNRSNLAARTWFRGGRSACGSATVAPTRRNLRAASCPGRPRRRGSVRRECRRRPRAARRMRSQEGNGGTDRYGTRDHAEVRTRELLGLADRGPMTGHDVASHVGRERAIAAARPTVAWRAEPGAASLGHRPRSAGLGGRRRPRRGGRPFGPHLCSRRAEMTTRGCDRGTDGLSKQPMLSLVALVGAHARRSPPCPRPGGPRGRVAATAAVRRGGVSVKARVATPVACRVRGRTATGRLRRDRSSGCPS